MSEDANLHRTWIKFRYLVTGFYAQRHKNEVLHIFDIDVIRSHIKYRLFDGHLPDSCPITNNLQAALTFLNDNPFQFVEVITN